ncbi:small ribosomal subunit protein bS21m [Hyperolius riggenbachi]|uniref:small ribosomal subunit protein bS21m n=1 Tax=Hyperolius riggenbachi TaxID=752182 RepID=UPI0035A3A67D
MANHLRFVARTVMVQNGNVDAAYKALNRILTSEGMVDEAQRRRYCEKPCIKKRRIKYETCKRIYTSEMQRKIAFLSRTIREDPWPGC